MQRKHDYSKINRSKKEADKLTNKLKKDIKLTKEDIEYAEKITEEEKGSDIMKWASSYKGNKLKIINKYLYDPLVMPKERRCYKFKASETRCKGKLRDHRVVEVNFIQANNRKPQFFVKINGKEIFAKAAQHEVIDELRKILCDK